MVCDSANVFSFGRAGSESDVRKNMLEVMSRKKKKNISNLICIKCCKDGNSF